MRKSIVIISFLLVNALFASNATYEAGLQAIQSSNYKEAAKIFQALSESGDRKGDHWLGVFYSQGLGVEKNLKEAEFRFSKAANAGLIGSTNKLARLYLGKCQAIFKKLEIWLAQPRLQAMQRECSLSIWQNYLTLN